jgi:hypothetical protein
MAIDPSADDMVCHCAVLSINDARSDRLIMGATAFGMGVQGRILDSLASYRACFSGSKGGGRRRGHSVPACFSILIAGRASDWAASRTVQQHPPPSPCTANVFYPATGRPAAHAGEAAMHMPSEVERNKRKSSAGGRAGQGESIVLLKKQVARLLLSHMELS